jgi:hypothetical protein
VLQLYWIVPTSYTLYALIVGQLGDVDTPMQSTGASGPVSGQTLQAPPLLLFCHARVWQYEGGSGVEGVQGVKLHGTSSGSTGIMLLLQHQLPPPWRALCAVPAATKAGTASHISAPALSPPASCALAFLLQPQTVSQFIEEFFGYEWGFRWWCVLIMAGYLLFFFVTCSWALKRINWQTR